MDLPRWKSRQRNELSHHAQRQVPLSKVCAGLSERHNQTTLKDCHDPDNLTWRNKTEDYPSTALGLRPPRPSAFHTPPRGGSALCLPISASDVSALSPCLLQEGCQDSTNLTPSSDSPGIICRRSLSLLSASHCFSASDLSHILLV